MFSILFPISDCNYFRRDGTGLEKALRSAWCDQTVRDMYFVTPWALERREGPACDIASETRPAIERKKASPIIALR